MILTKALGTVNDSVTVDVGEGSLHEQAVSRPFSAASLSGLNAVAAGVEVGVPLSNTESMMTEAISICWAAAIILRRTVGAAVIVVVSTTVVVAKMRCVDV